LARGPIVGREAIADVAKNFRDTGVRFEPVIVNGGPGLLARFPARSLLWAFTVTNGRIVEIDLIADPDKLRDPPSL
jgi:hypothetical protein